MYVEGEEWLGDIADTVEPRPILESVRRFDGRIWSIRSDTVDVAGRHVVRDVQQHLGAVAVIAIDAQDRVLLIRQYRHPVAMALFEPPAGLLDIPGETPHSAAVRIPAKPRKHICPGRGWISMRPRISCSLVGWGAQPQYAESSPRGRRGRMPGPRFVRSTMPGPRGRLWCCMTG